MLKMDTNDTDQSQGRQTYQWLNQAALIRESLNSDLWDLREYFGEVALNTCFFSRLSQAHITSWRDVKLDSHLSGSCTLHGM